MASVKPTILLVHGAWHDSSCFAIIKSKLEALSYPIATVDLPTSGSSVASASWKDDVDAIYRVAVPLMDEGKELLLVAHSYGGIPSTASTQNHSIEERKKAGKQGGFKGLLYVTAFAIPAKGMTLKQTFGGHFPPWLEEKDGYAIASPGAKHAFYSDLPEEQADSLYKLLHKHTLSAFGTPVDFVASDLTIPSWYMICETDAVLPVAFQEMLVAGVPGMKSERCTAGHSPFLSQPDRTVEVILIAADA